MTITIKIVNITENIRDTKLENIKKFSIINIRKLLSVIEKR